MLRSLAIIVCGLTALAAAEPARAQNTGPVFVVPTRPGVPVVLHGRDVSYVVVEGDWGLARPGHMTPTIIGYAPPVGDRASPIRGIYHPRYGAPPPRGRFEVEPVDRSTPEPAETYRRSWGSQPEQPVVVVPREPPPVIRPQAFNAGIDTMPATIIDPQTYDVPMIVAPQVRRRR